jgi:hypothetical protein
LRYVLTIATGKKLYVDLAVNLARSFLYWHTGSEIIFQLVTDQPELVSRDVYDKIQVIIVKEGELGLGFSPKLHLDKLVSEGETIFIDSDCLVYGDLSHVFEKFKGHNISVVGNYISTGEWFGSVAEICRKFNVKQIPKFNGGLYYIEKGDKATEVYSLARRLEAQYDEIGFIRLRNRPNDEVIIALAMAMNNEQPVIDDGSIMSDPQACPGRYKLDVLKGNTLMINPPLPHPDHRTWYPFEKVSPLIVHFLGYYTLHYPYRREVYLLEKALNNNLNWITNLKSLIGIEYPERLKLLLKNTFRTAFHKFFGVRKIKKSERVIS